MSTPSNQLLEARVSHLVITAIVAVAFLGFFAGINQSLPDSAPVVDASIPNQKIPTAPTYGEMLVKGPIPPPDQGPSLAALALDQRASQNLSGLEPLDAELARRGEALGSRMARRAYDGAPPRIPHASVERGGLGCLSCHAEGFAVNGRTAPAVSHPAYSSCTQCHVAEEPSLPPEMARLSQVVGDSQFKGLEPLAVGTRAWTGAPPTIPHSTLMRETCMSCHGPSGRNGLKTSHPSRQSCQQCHAPGASLDQRPVSALPGAVGQ